MLDTSLWTEPRLTWSVSTCREPNFRSDSTCREEDFRWAPRDCWLLHVVLARHRACLLRVWTRGLEVGEVWEPVTVWMDPRTTSDLEIGEIFESLEAELVCDISSLDVFRPSLKKLFLNIYKSKHINHTHWYIFCIFFWFIPKLAKHYFVFIWNIPQHLFANLLELFGSVDSLTIPSLL